MNDDQEYEYQRDSQILAEVENGTFMHKLQTFDDVEQGTDLWHELRAGVLTASTIGQLITPGKLQAAQNDKSRALVRRIAVERITGRSADTTVQTRDMLRGHMDEPLARAYYEQYHAPVHEIGFMKLTTQFGTVGYSPDGLVGDDGLIEIKSRKPDAQLSTILTGEPPSFHMAQLQTGLFVSGRAWIDYVSFCSGMPLAVYRVLPDEAWQDAIRQVVATTEEQVLNLLRAYRIESQGMPATEYVDHFADEIRI